MSLLQHRECQNNSTLKTIQNRQNRIDSNAKGADKE